MNALQIKDLHVRVGETPILRGVDLTVPAGQVHALMGPNGSGKSSLAFALAGHPRYEVTQGSASLDGHDLLALDPDHRSRLGLFLAFQYPSEVPGITLEEFLLTAVQARSGEPISMDTFRPRLLQVMAELEVDPKFARRFLNDGFSGGEKKRCEKLQMALLDPRYAILDETDSGLDIDALRIVSEGVNRLRAGNMGVLAITHYTRILTHLKPDRIHVLMDGTVVRSGGPDLADELERQGYDFLRSTPTVVDSGTKG